MIDQCLRGDTGETLKYFEGNLRYFLPIGVSKNISSHQQEYIDHKSISIDLNLNIQIDMPV